MGWGSGGQAGEKNSDKEASFILMLVEDVFKKEVKGGGRAMRRGQ